MYGQGRGRGGGGEGQCRGKDGMMTKDAGERAQRCLNPFVDGSWQKLPEFLVWCSQHRLYHNPRAASALTLLPPARIPYL